MKRIAILCAGRGSYTEKTMRTLDADEPWVRRADELRADYGLVPLSELDSAERFSAALHLKPSNVSPLIWLVTMLDARAAQANDECVCVAGNSMGWYTALAVGGALSFDDGFRLVQEMSLLQERHGVGGQVLYPLVDAQWRRDPELARVVHEALVSSAGQALPSIALGGFAVLAGTEQGIAHLLRALPQVKLGANTYPFRLIQHGAYHTPFVSAASEEARTKLARLEFRAPRTTLIDGRGVRFTPWSTDVAALADYTFGAQVVEPYDFTLSVRVALREHAPDALVLPGPGNTLGGICGQILIAEGWRALASKADFERDQQGPRPLVHSLRR
ncbi:MAG: ACP S-malonyltransferase [Planctomycetes bacterium]|nr:ACP S-malonyltransferase [Planctomycetota bacterium]